MPDPELADQRDRLTGANGERDPADQLDVVDRDGEPLDLQQRPIGGGRLGHGPIAGAPARTQPERSARGGAARVERRLQPIAEQVEGEDGAGQRQGGPDQEERRDLHGAPGGADHQPPGRRRRHDTKAKKAEAALDHDRRGDDERHLHEQRRRHVGQDCPPEDAQGMRAHGPLRRDEVEPADLLRGGIDDAGVVRRIEDRQGDDQRPRASAEDSDHEERQQQRRQAQDGLGGAHGEKLGDAAEIAAEKAEGGADDCSRQRRAHSDGERCAAAPDQPRQHVATELVLPEPVLGGGCGEAVRHVHRAHVGKRKDRRQHDDRQDQRDDRAGQDELARGAAHVLESEMRGSSAAFTTSTTRFRSTKRTEMVMTMPTTSG